MDRKKTEKRRKQFETVSNWEEWRKEGKLYLVAFHRRQTGRIESPQVGQVFRKIQTEQGH